MNEDFEKQIKKLISKATVVDSVDIPRDEIVDMKSFDDFLRFKGELYFFEKQDAFYKKGGSVWMRYLIRPEAEELPATGTVKAKQSLPSFGDEPAKEKEKDFDTFGNALSEECKTDLEALREEIAKMQEQIAGMQKWQADTVEWAHKIRDYIDRTVNYFNIEIKKLKTAQDEGFATLKDNFELRIEQVKQELQNARKR